jgi:hypothetical protein
MSKVKSLDLGLIARRLRLAVEGAGGPEHGSCYLRAIGALYLSAAPESPFEAGLWASLFEFQAVEENVNGAELLATLANVEAP